VTSLLWLELHYIFQGCEVFVPLVPCNYLSSQVFIASELVNERQALLVAVVPELVGWFLIVFGQVWFFCQISVYWFCSCFVISTGIFLQC
jgi:hypothetical protein